MMTPLSTEEANLLQEIDFHIGRIQKIVRVQDPYFLSCAGGHANRHHKHPVQAALERKETPFDEDEDHLQYGTWIFRDKTGPAGQSNSCINLHGGVEEIERRQKKVQAASSTATSISASSDAQTPKVRLSLKEYRNRKQGGPAISSALKSPSLAVQKLPPATKHDKVSINGTSRDYKTAGSIGNQAAADQNLPRGQKRPRIAGMDHDPNTPVGSSTKKRRLSPLPAMQHNKREDDSWRNDLPELLSPAQDPKKHPPHGLNPLLSPLPEIVPKIFYDDFLSEKETLTEGLAKKTQSFHSPQPSASSDDADTPIRHIKEEAKSSATKPPSLVAILKYGRDNKRAVERILRHIPRPGRSGEPLLDNPTPTAERGPRDSKFHDAADVEAEVSATTRAETQGGLKTKPKISNLSRSSLLGAFEPANSKAASKRKMEADDGPRKKQQQMASQQNRGKNPQTPDNINLRSPVSGHHRSDSQKSLAPMHLTPTPLRDVRESSNMRRTLSQESVSSTPKPSQPTPVPSNRSVPNVAPAANGVHVDVSHLSLMISELRDTGKRLKTAFSELQNRVSAKSSPPTTAERKLGAVLGLESLLAYLLSFAAEDAMRRLQKRKANLGNWTTMRGLFESIKRLTREFAHLDGLQHHIGVAICSRVSTVWADRPSVERAAHVNEIGTCLIDAHNWSFEAWNKLSVDDLILSYPNTWSRRKTGDREPPGNKSMWEHELSGIAADLRDDVDVRAGDFWFPLAPDSGPLQCVRFALCILEEFAGREKLNYRISLKI